MTWLGFATSFANGSDASHVMVTRCSGAIEAVILSNNSI
jgi:hypothetical protein